MKNLISIISQNSTHSTPDKLRKFIDQSREDEKAKSKYAYFQQRILQENIPKQYLSVQIKQSQFSNSLEYKKGLIKYYLKKNIKDLLETEKQELNNVQSLEHLKKFLSIRDDGKVAEKSLELIENMQKQSTQLKKILKNTFLIDQVTLICDKAKNDTQVTLQNLVKKSNKSVSNNNIVVYMKPIKNCMEKIKDPGIFTYWMFKVFDNLIQYDPKKKVLRLDSLELQKSENVENRQVYGFNINPIFLKFNKSSSSKQSNKSDKIKQINVFLEQVENTFACVGKIHQQIKDRLIKLEKKQQNQEEKKRYNTILGIIKQEEIFYKKKIGEEIFPTVYILTLVGTEVENAKNDEQNIVKFNIQRWQKLCKLFDIEKTADINSMPSLLQSYRYSIEPSLIEEIESKFKQIPKRIASKLIHSKGDEQFKQVCFFLEINTIISNNNKKGLQDADLSLSLVSSLITDCIDQIPYEKIEHLLKIQRAIQEYKAKSL